MIEKDVYLRKDGRWEARLTIGKDEGYKRIYRSFYGETKEIAKQKRASELARLQPDWRVTEFTVKDVTLEYLKVIGTQIKESTASNYQMKAEKATSKNLHMRNPNCIRA